jgi:hypothetical protein
MENFGLSRTCFAVLDFGESFKMFPLLYVQSSPFYLKAYLIPDESALKECLKYLEIDQFKVSLHIYAQS